jgi:hypothetical protein
LHRGAETATQIFEIRAPKDFTDGSSETIVIVEVNDPSGRDSIEPDGKQSVCGVADPTPQAARRRAWRLSSSARAAVDHSGRRHDHGLACRVGGSDVVEGGQCVLEAEKCVKHPACLSIHRVNRKLGAYATAHETIVCDRQGEWVIVDMQNSHHGDYQSLKPTSREDCDKILLKRLEGYLR